MPGPMPRQVPVFGCAHARVYRPEFLVDQVEPFGRREGIRQPGEAQMGAGRDQGVDPGGGEVF